MSENPPRTESELVELLHSIDVRAPEALHGRIDALVAERGRSRVRGGRRELPRFGLALGGALAAVAALAIVLVLAIGGGSSPSLDLRQATALTLSPATMAAPRERPHGNAELTADVEGISFPYWEDRFGWRATGARSDRIGGHSVETVLYANAAGQQIGYMIVSGIPAPKVGGGRTWWRGHTAFRLHSENGTQVVTWLRDGHLCVVAGRGVGGATLLRLASWKDQGTPS